MQNKFLKLILKLLHLIVPVLFWFAIWDIAALIVDHNYFLPTVKQTFSALLKILSSFSFYRVVFFTVLRVLIGLALGIVLAIILTFVSCKSKIAKAIISPLISVMKATPVVTLIIVLWIMLSSETLPIVIAILMVMPIVWQNLIDGYETIDQSLTEVCFVFEFSIFKRFKYLIFPTLLKYFIPSVITAAGLAWKSEIATEIIAYTKNSIGKFINDANYSYDSPAVFAWTLVIIALSISLEFLTKRLMKRFKV